MMRNAKEKNCALTRAPNQGGAESMKELDEGTHPVRVLPAQSPMTAGASAVVELFQTQKKVRVDGEGAQKPHPLTPLTAEAKKRDTGSQEEGDRIRTTMTYLDLGDVRK